MLWLWIQNLLSETLYSISLHYGMTSIYFWQTMMRHKFHPESKTVFESNIFFRKTQSTSTNLPWLFENFFFWVPIFINTFTATVRIQYLWNLKIQDHKTNYTAGSWNSIFMAEKNGIACILSQLNTVNTFTHYIPQCHFKLSSYQSPFLGTFMKLWKATISFVMPAQLST